MTTEILLRSDWQPRPYQKPLFRYLRGGGKRAVAVWHRRAGKDATALHWTKEAALGRVGTYWHMLPTLRQGRLVVWDGITKEGRKVMDAWPDELIKHRRNDEMKLELANGSVWQVVGSDNYNSLVGANPVGVVVSEWSLADPACWDFIRPILAENGGWALFIYTPRGRNHGHELHEIARRNDNWFAEVLSVDDTNAIGPEVIEEERAAGMADELIAQEFYCSFEAPLTGAYYSKQMTEAMDEGRIGGVPHDPAIEVESWWDLGIGDATAIFFAQVVGREIHLIDYYETSGEGLAHYAGKLADLAKPKSEGGRDFNYGRHILPHDVKARELGTGKTREEVLKTLGLKPTICPQHRVDDGIEAVRNLLAKCWIDEEHCSRGIDALRQYRKAWDETNRCYRNTPLHDWTSHGADALRYGAMMKPAAGKLRPIVYPENHVSRGIV